MLDHSKLRLRRRRGMLACAAGLLAVVAATLHAQNGDSSPPARPTVAPSVDVKTETATPAPTTGQPAALKDPETYGLWVLAPAVAAIVLAILLRSAVPALAVGVVIAAYMLVPCLDASQRLTDNTLLAGLRIAFERYAVEALSEPGSAQKTHILIIIFTLLIGGMAGVISVNGGTQAFVDRMSKYASNSRRGQLVAWIAGLIIFFDDYANSMIIGPTMRPMFDRLRISRAKLAYIVDSTAAPVASLVMIGTWIGAELGYIQDGLDALAATAGGTPQFLSGVDSKTIFVNSIPYRFYPILAIWIVFVIAVTRRDFGPMRKAESRALTEPPTDVATMPVPGGSGSDGRPGNAWFAVLPILVLIGATMGVLYYSGRASLPAGEEATLVNIARYGDSYLSILYGGLGALTVAIVVSVAGRACRTSVAVDGALDGMAKMFPALVILVLAWALSQASQDLHLGQVVKAHLLRMDIAPPWLPLPVWLPLSIFLAACAVSFATGTSWATMGILTPVVIQIAAPFAATLPPDQQAVLFNASVGAVLAGSIFGDHCSPISDTTVLSAIASSCRVEDHVWTQMPYAVVTALVAIGAGNVYCMYQHESPWMGLLIGAGALLVIVLVVGRTPTAPEPVTPIPPRRFSETGT